MARDLRPVYTAPSEAAAKERWGEFAGKWGARYPAIVRLWDNACPSSCRSWTTEPVAESRRARMLRRVLALGAWRCLGVGGGVLLVWGSRELSCEKAGLSHGLESDRVGACPSFRPLGLLGRSS